MFAEASNARLSFIEEVTWGTTPATPAMQRLRFKNESLAATLDFTESEEITPTAAVSDVIPTGAGAGGDAAYEMSYGTEMITLIEHALRGTMDAFGIIKAEDQKKSMTLHKELVVDDSHSAYFTYPGARVGTWSVDLSVDGNTPVGGTFNFLAKVEDEEYNSDLADSYVASNTNPVFSMPHLRGVAVTDIADKICFSDLSFTVENTLRAQNGKCTDTSVFPDLQSKGIGYGQRKITGNMSAYLANLNIYEKFKSFGEFSLSFLMTDGVRGFKVTFPRVKITEGSANAEGNDSDVLQPFAYQALYDETEGTDMIVESIGNIGTDAGIKLTDTDPISTPTDVAGVYYTDEAVTTEGGQPVRYSVNGLYAIWFDGSDLLVTDVDEVGSAITTLFSVLGSSDPESIFASVSGTGELTGGFYDPLT